MSIPVPLASPARTQVAARRLAAPARRAVLTAHVISSVGLLGASLGVLLMALTGGLADDPTRARAAYELMHLSGVALGVPLSFTALFSGIALGLGTRWGVVRHAWVRTKLMLLVATIVNGAAVIGPTSEAMAAGGAGQEARLIVAAACSVTALAVSTGLSVYKPGARRRRG